MLSSKSKKYIVLGFFLLILSYLSIIWFNPSSQSSPILNSYEGWDSGSVRHILPSFDHERLLMKSSFYKEQSEPPILKINDVLIHGEKNDPKGFFWQFYYDQLQPNTAYKLQILNSDASKNTDAWTIQSYPHPDSNTAHLKVLTYTCAGGVEDKFLGKDIFISISARQELLKKGLSEHPQIVIANGDHIYWDQLSFKTSVAKRLLSAARDRIYGTLDLDKPMLSDENYAVFTRLANAQIADLYGCYLREQSVHFVTDDHDLFENDEALPDLITLPPAPYMLDAGRATQKLYYPELRSPANVSTGLVNQERTLSTSFGQINFGNLASFALYDCKRYCTLADEDAVLVPNEIEKWIINGIRDTMHRWQFQVPSSPFGWTAGKWSEWYPDVLDNEGKLVTSEEKYMWPVGWWTQHQRLISAMGSSLRPSIVIQGDLHMAGFGSVRRSGDIELSEASLHLIAGPPLGSGTMAFPSSFRGTGSKVPQDLEVDELFTPIEKNGFTILDINRERVRLNMYTWRPPENEADIRTLRPSFSYDIEY